MSYFELKDSFRRDDPSHVLETDHGNGDENLDPIQDEMELGMVETLNKIIGKGDLRTKLKSKEGEKVRPKSTTLMIFMKKMVMHQPNHSMFYQISQAAMILEITKHKKKLICYTRCNKSLFEYKKEG